jgi:SpoVK/Ycf46/Vps4 family AAA+-type ATPase
MKHAVGFTKPKNITSIQVYDFTKIAGLKVAKSTIKNIIEKPIKYSFLFKTVPIKLPRGILLYGATGNGKSALGLAVKDEFKMKYFSVKGSDILSKYIGGSEAAVRDIF